MAFKCVGRHLSRLFERSSKCHDFRNAREYHAVTAIQLRLQVNSVAMPAAIARSRGELRRGSHEGLEYTSFGVISKIAGRLARSEEGEMSILPSQRLVRGAAVIALVAIAAIPIPILMAPVLAMLAILSALAGADLIAARREVAPSLERIIPDRLVKGRPATIIYKVSRRSGGATTFSVLDELPSRIRRRPLHRRCPHRRRTIDRDSARPHPDSSRHARTRFHVYCLALTPGFVSDSRAGCERWQRRDFARLLGAAAAERPHASPAARRVGNSSAPRAW